MKSMTDVLQVTGGRNGYGAKLANIFSTEFIVETADGKNSYKQRFRKNMTKKEEPVIKACKDRYTRITFYPELARFGMQHFDSDIVALFTKRAYDIAGCNGDVKVYINGERIMIKSFQKYMDMYLKDSPQLPRIFEKVNDRWEVGITLSEGVFTQVSFVNSICTYKGGKHVGMILLKQLLLISV